MAQPSDPEGALPGTQQEPHLSVHLETGTQSVDSTVVPEVGPCPNASPTDQGPETSPVLLRIRIHTQLKPW